jgi:hypothetical protein
VSKPLLVGIFPDREHDRRARLWAALEAAYPVRFQGRRAGEWRDLDGIVALAPLESLPPVEIPCLSAMGDEAGGGSPRTVTLAREGLLARPLHGARLSDTHATALQAEALSEGETVLARLDGAPAWVALRSDLAPRHRVACVPAELDEGEALRERLQAGRCLALLALAQFLGDLCIDAGVDERRGPLRAAFVIDDPNLHWPSYGHLRYAELLSHAREHGYHLAIAMAPLDGWLSHPRAVRLFREGVEQLSICVHGNDHDGPELGRERSWPESVALATQALRRTAAFQRRTGLAVDRVMVPPHERVSESAARALRVCGFQAICTTRPYPWISTSAAVSWLQGPPEASQLSGWGPIDMVAGGLPMLLRTDFRYPREDHVLRAFLGQPVILYGHHDLFAEGLDVLAEAAAEIDRLGDVRWSSLGEIARECTQSAHSRTAPHSSGGTLADSQAPLEASGQAMVSLPPWRMRPILRRLASEGRDRLQAVI